MTKNTLQNFDLKKQVCLITGGAGFLGLKHAEALLDGNGRVVLLDVNDERLSDAVSKLKRAYPRRIWGYQLDITNENLVKKTVNKIEREIGPISVLINNAANNPQVGQGQKDFSRLENFPIEVWQKDFDVGVTGAFLMSKYAGSLMAKRGKGVILNISSDLGVIAPDQRLYRKEGLKSHQQPVKPVTYSVTKHALIGLTKYLATYWAESGIRVNSISPGGVYRNTPEEFVQKLAKLIPLGRMATQDEYKAAILFLCSDASSYMTGANLIMDGGRTVW
ncbi:MAG: oxidoreductase [Candidatus Yanofskybacteria bacterium RIFCSPHIGHO2_01_FULL_43_42]|uniref:Oxidoreductase n=1 Tax=Candidatus Yanofskybacteria bacterium RIFCSPLOWO2_01_FULL_43_22 TaxID=1802695 RepID=A0A1F8GJY0_9BACT|nr:MAG: oxidoreductase [Candidatus Yanofskybacteria bacterium RIFCSPHIGHO2_01_FULL_43_42]OGN13313.1 MAG: oxidoreductase [Candidatus Yanofskybacteria bacterium RIFCSPHIGHO2_02_FULL_43_17]OGN24729.1 MAG: oxidoreductase [Candidatus Yanofskybacteria bacterium RIFCSPLOWO2_01_FULL_43_22]